MEVINQFLKEILHERFKIAAINGAMNSVLLYLLTNFFLGLTPIYPILIGAGAFALSVYYYLRIYDLSYIESKNRSVNEMLTAARDNADKTNIVIVMLFKDIASRAREISFEALLNKWTFYGRLFGVIGLVVATTFITPAQVNGALADLASGLFSQVDKLSAGLKNTKDILSDGSLFDLGSKEFELSLSPSANEIDFEQEQASDKEAFALNDFPSDANAYLDTLNAEKLPEEFELVKEYSLRVRANAG